MSEVNTSLLKRARDYFAERQCAEAAACYLAAGELAENDAVKLAECYLNLKLFNEALELLANSSDNRRVFLTGQAKLGLGRIEEAIENFQAYINTHPKDPDGLIELAAALEIAGNDTAASKLYEDVKFDHPEFFRVLIDRAHQFHKYKLFNLARGCLQRAEKIARADPGVFYELGLCYLDLFFSDTAENALKQAIKLRPTLEGYRELAIVLERANKIDQALTFCQVPMDQEPNDPGLNYVVAKCEFRQGNEDKALAILKAFEGRFEDPTARAEAFNLMGRVYDRKGQVDKAYAAFVKSKDAMKESKDFAELDVNRAAKVIAGYRKAGLEIKQALPLITPKTRRPLGHVFFAGFPRSGTTLVEQMLQSHPAVVAIDEKPTVRILIRELEDMKSGYPDALRGLSANECEILRDMYFLQARNYADYDENTVLVDKFPLNITHMPLILTLFPKAKILFARRHPFAACLSCLMQNFSFNDAMGNMTGLNEITRFYDLVMGFWLDLNKAQDIPAYSYRYEDLVANPENEARKMVSFLGLKWDETMLQYQKTAKEKGIINTPSYSQVVEPIYTDALEKWRAYEAYFKPFQDRLMPYVRAFGYSS